MKQRTNYFAFGALVLASLLVVFALQMEGSALYKTAHKNISLPTAANSSVEVSTGRLAELRAKAARFDARAAALEQTETDRRATSSPSSSTTDQSRGLIPATISENNFIEASMIGRPPQTPYDTAVLSVGRGKGVSLGGVVWWPAGVHLGEVVSVGEETATVRLVSTAGVRHAVRVASSTIETVGRGGDSLYAEISQDIAVSVGESVVSDSSSLPLGVVVATQDIEARNLQGLYISGLAPINQIETVYVQIR